MTLCKLQHQNLILNFPLSNGYHDRPTRCNMILNKHLNRNGVGKMSKISRFTSRQNLWDNVDQTYYNLWDRADHYAQSAFGFSLDENSRQSSAPTTQQAAYHRQLRGQKLNFNMHLRRHSHSHLWNYFHRDCSHIIPIVRAAWNHWSPNIPSFDVNKFSIKQDCNSGKIRACVRACVCVCMARQMSVLAPRLCPSWRDARLQAVSYSKWSLFETDVSNVSKRLQSSKTDGYRVSGRCPALGEIGLDIKYRFDLLSVFTNNFNYIRMCF